MIENNSDVGTLASEIKKDTILTNENIVKVITEKKLKNSNFVQSCKFFKKGYNKSKILISTII